MDTKRSYLIDSTTKKLEHYILNSGLKVGSLIPKETDLAEKIGVSRPILRESLGRLKAQGLLEARRKRGTVLTTPNFTNVIRSGFNPNMLDENTLKNLFALRLTLEVGMADFIMHNKTPEDIAALREITRDEPSADKPLYFDPDHEFKFHGKLYAMTHNESLMNFQELLLPLFHYVHTSGLLSKIYASVKQVTHKDLVDIIETGTAEDLRAGMRQHLDPHYQRLLK